MIAQENKRAKGNLSSNFSDVQDKDCIIVDDVVTSGRPWRKQWNIWMSTGKVQCHRRPDRQEGTEEIAGVPVVSR